MEQINWGQPDRALGRAACESIMRVTTWQLPLSRQALATATVCGWCAVIVFAAAVLALAAAGVKA
ncbi:MAG TPA: hypothetical protein VJM50_24030 [Pyrinomonadaceae bacterium]|nr:hypothetical protein [Pyrinomonadaceae bacterium]